MRTPGAEITSSRIDSRPRIYTTHLKLQCIRWNPGPSRTFLVIVAVVYANGPRPLPVDIATWKNSANKKCSLKYSLNGAVCAHVSTCGYPFPHSLILITFCLLSRSHECRSRRHRGADVRRVEAARSHRHNDPILGALSKTALFGERIRTGHVFRSGTGSQTKRN